MTIHDASQSAEPAGTGSRQSQLDSHYWDDVSGGHFTTSDDHERLLARDKPARDRPTRRRMPAGRGEAPRFPRSGPVEVQVERHEAATFASGAPRPT